MFDRSVDRNISPLNGRARTCVLALFPGDFCIRMARSGDDLISCKRDAKLENFLKQKLGDHVFERIRAYEACIAQSRKVKRGYKFVVLSDEKIYITDNPPKVIRAEESVHLGDVTSINLVRFYYCFLFGEFGRAGWVEWEMVSV